MRNKLIYKHQNGYVIQSDNTRVDPIVLQPRVPNFTKLNQSKLGKAMLDKTKKENPQFYNKKVRLEAHKAKSNPEMSKIDKILNGFISAAVAENPAVATAAGWSVDRNGKATQDINSEGAKKLRENLPILATGSLGAI